METEVESATRCRVVASSARDVFVHQTHLLDVLRYWTVYARSEEFTRALPECGDPTRLLNVSDTSHEMTNAVTSSPPSDSGG